MKTLLIMRHAKSSWDDSGTADHERTLTARGERDAPRMGKLLRREGMVPQAIVASDAVRAQATARAVAEGSGFEGQVEFSSALYGAGPETYREVLAKLPERVDSVLVVGHNPASEELLEELTGEDEHLQTAAIAQVELDIADWGDWDEATAGRLVNIWRPKEVKSE
jgi:phosphohistidine phosphatase